MAANADPQAVSLCWPRNSHPKGTSKMNRTRPKQIVIRLSEEEYAKLKAKVEKSGLKQQDYLIKAITNKSVTNTDGLKELIPEIKRVGNNLNQLSRKANEGLIVGLDELEQAQKELAEVWQSLKQFIQKQA